MRRADPNYPLAGQDYTSITVTGLDDLDCHRPKCTVVVVALVPHHDEVGVDLVGVASDLTAGLAVAVLRLGADTAHTGAVSHRLQQGRTVVLALVDDEFCRRERRLTDSGRIDDVKQ